MEAVKLRLSPFNESGLYQVLFDNSTKFELQETGILGLNLEKLGEKYFNDQFFPEDKKLIEHFNANLSLNNSVRTSIIFALTHFLNLSSEGPKILAIEKWIHYLHHNTFSKS